ncbi:heme exporter protein CcmB [Gammaproteobacteria bacterium]|jgi:heme exporter protein B|nr:heme exporter protein CcmB [Gammaproteobacteria bacterium]MDA7697400.1 heme exporter protein CcmB [Gammaproteobacteria bacterium]MDA8854326.1 heme exporter protein CcmB [Gammaproteobacteria bacterium]MDC1444120.1 heme exporter protein CcmB [Gammaproteobacteria bacterium]|tara:strand:- start:717 stop:1364 length:648 start_codon:yes stop_codon:yes gene_type:complete
MKLLKFELLKLRKKSRGWLGPILVFVLIMTAFPLTVEILNKDIDQSFLSVLWIATLLVMMLATEDIFLEDFNDGTLEQMAIKHNSLSGVITIKIFVYWLLIGLPISLLGALYGFGITSSADLAIQLIPILMITTYIFLNVFSFGNALSLTKGSILGILITMPLVLPLLVVLGKVVIAINLGMNFLGFLFLLLGILSIIILVLPIIISFVIKAHLE